LRHGGDAASCLFYARAKVVHCNTGRPQLAEGRPSRSAARNGHKVETTFSRHRMGEAAQWLFDEAARLYPGAFQ
jgi:hypothetical protein